MPSKTYDEETRRRLLCDHLGREALAGAERVAHRKCAPLHLGEAPPPAPALPYGSVWTLVNHLKVLRQYGDLITAAASGEGPHALPLSACPEACTGGLEWFAPLLGAVPRCERAEARVGCWRQANPGLFCDAEAAFHAHQEAFPEAPDLDLCRLLARCLDPSARELDAEVASGLLRLRPSFDEFRDAFTGWRGNGLYHLLGLAARRMPEAVHWVPPSLVHEAGDWQGLLDHFNSRGHCAPGRMEEAFLSLWDRSAQLSNRICATLDRLAILARVWSKEPSLSFEDCLARMRLPQGAFEQPAWFALKGAAEAAPPSLLCPALHPPNRSTWGYRRLRLLLRDGRPYIHTGDLSWIDRGELGRDGRDAPADAPPDRLHDILLRAGEAATAPEVAHLMLHPESLSEALAGRRVIPESLPNLADRALVLGEMDRPAPGDGAYRACLDRLMAALPPSTSAPLGAQLLAWRVDCPPRVILYHGHSTDLDLSAHPPHRLHKSLRQDRVPNRTVSGISLLGSLPDQEPLDHEGVHAALRACIAEEVVGPHARFSEHPHHQAPVRPIPAGLNSRFLPTEPVPHTTTTLAEAVRVFTGPPAAELSEVPLHGSRPWTEDHVDGRYAERQVAANGSRFRDWVAVYYDPHEPVQRCRLASHALTVPTVHRTHLPLIGSEGASWVSVASSLPVETVMLRRQAGEGLEALRRSVDARFMHDGKLLPVRHPGDRVEREHMEIYSDRAAGQVLIAYAPRSEDGTRRGLEFVSFMHAK